MLLCYICKTPLEPYDPETLADYGRAHKLCVERADRVKKEKEDAARRDRIRPNVRGDV